jgi:pimeloyl-ACP methyl ester carboxylesterase
MNAPACWLRRVALLGLVAVVACEGAAPGGSKDAGTPAPSVCAGETAPITLDTGSGTLAGTLTLPARCPPVVVALIHAGSGPTDRDGNSAGIKGRNDSLKMLAEGLAAGGIASVRYDKRGIAESVAAGPRSERELRFSSYVEDAGRWLVQLGADARFRGVVVIGHSEGSLIGLLAAQGAPGTRFISIAGPGRPAGTVLREQLAVQLGGSPLLATADGIIDELEAGREVTSVPAALNALFRPSVQPYLIDWFRHDPAAVVAALVPAPLVVQGTTDLQVGVADAKLLAAGHPGARLALIEGMNHVLKQVSGDQAAQAASYGDPDLPLHPRLVGAVVEFIDAAK